MEPLSIRQKLSAIQCEIKAKKNKYNAFGKYNYRNLESIYEAVKPLLEKYGCFLVIDNDIVVKGDKIFRQSIATLGCIENETDIKVETYTQEALDKKGMSPEQCSGSSASYGDKYVLNKMFCLDDSDDTGTDPDSNNSLLNSSKNPGDYKPLFGKHMGKPLKSIDPKELKDFCVWLSKQGDLGDMQKEMLSKAREFLSK